MSRALPSSVSALAVVALLLMLGPLASGHSLPAAESAPACPPFPGANAFVVQIDNRSMPLIPGTTYVYRGSEDGEEQRNTVEVTHETKSILGVDAVVVHDTVRDKHGNLIEDTLDWFAQDNAGNV